MIAMQYSFTLPADYDMAIIDRRIVERGGSTDNFPKLLFKAYLTARRGEESAENLYAPFYVWREPEGLSNFLCGPGFAALTSAFGWPEVATWVVWRAAISNEIAAAQYATRELLTTEPYAPLADLRRRESDDAAADVAGGVLASVSAFEPTTWTRVRFRLWRDKPAAEGGVQIYRAGHISQAEA
jgi:hypothetical protein